MSFPNARITTTKTWNTLKTLIVINNDNGGISDSIKIDKKLTKDSNKIANKCCGYFSKLGTRFDQNFLIRPNTFISI